MDLHPPPVLLDLHQHSYQRIIIIIKSKVQSPERDETSSPFCVKFRPLWATSAHCAPSAVGYTPPLQSPRGEKIGFGEGRGKRAKLGWVG